MSFLQNEDNNYLVRAHCPTAMARLLNGLPAEDYDKWNAEVAKELVARCDKKSKEQNEIKQSSVLALGIVGRIGALGAAFAQDLSAAAGQLSSGAGRVLGEVALIGHGGATMSRPARGGKTTAAALPLCSAAKTL